MVHSEEVCGASVKREMAVWVPEEYDAGYQARRENISEFKTATRSWQAGWQDGDREIAGGGEASEESPCGDAIQQQGSLFGAGDTARACELPFDEDRGEVWKRNWIAADIALGLGSRLRCR